MPVPDVFFWELVLKKTSALCSEDAADDAASKAKSAGKDAKGNVKSAADDVKVCSASVHLTARSAVCQECHPGGSLSSGY